MREDWQHITAESGSKTEKEVLSAFIKLIRTGMKADWDSKMQFNNS